VAVAWAAMVASWIMRRLTRGHEAVTAVARRVAAGDLSARVDVDVSDPEARQLAGDVNKMIERLSALLAAHEEVVTHAAHELRSPMTTLYGELAHALRRARDGEGYRVAITAALESTQRLRELAENLLTMARIGGTAEEPLDPVSLGEVLERAARAVQGAAAERQVVLDIDYGTFVVWGRARDLERLFCNLYENAIRHSPVGARVTVTAASDGARVRVHVIDRGPGVPSADRERIFRPFFRSSASYGTPGYGLGLAIARKVARAHAGDVTLAERVDGAEFVVELARA